MKGKLGVEEEDDLDIDFGDEAIPFGSFYLFFTMIGIISLIVIKKRKVLLKQRLWLKPNDIFFWFFGIYEFQKSKIFYFFKHFNFHSSK